MSRLQLLIVAACAAIALVGAVALLGPKQNQPLVRSTGAALVGGPIKLTGHKGTPVTDDEFRGRYMLVFFGYTYCPDVCPAGLQVMTGALEELGSKADNIQPLFITIDPERDTVPVMASYVENFHPRLVGLTGTADEIATVAKSYRVYYKKAGDDEDYLMDHSSILYLMGPKGEFVKHFAYGTDTEALAREISAAVAAN